MREEPTRPKVAASIPDTRSEEERQEDGTAALEALGWFVVRLSQKRATSQTPGISDNIVMGFGVIAFVEWKSDKGVHSADQKTFQGHVRANGGRYCVWRNTEDALAFAASVMERTQSEERTG